MRYSRHRDPLATVRYWVDLILFASLTILFGTGLAVAENVTGDYSRDIARYYCRGWQDGVGTDDTRIRFIARMIGEEYTDDGGFEIVALGDINGDGRDDFMVSVRNKCEWRII